MKAMKNSAERMSFMRDLIAAGDTGSLATVLEARPYLSGLSQAEAPPRRLARRLQACAALRTSVRERAEKVAEAALVVCEAAIAVSGCTQDLRMVFGRCIGAAAGSSAGTPCSAKTRTS